MLTVQNRNYSLANDCMLRSEHSPFHFTVCKMGIIPALPTCRNHVRMDLLPATHYNATEHPKLKIAPCLKWWGTWKWETPMMMINYQFLHKMLKKQNLGWSSLEKEHWRSVWRSCPPGFSCLSSLHLCNDPERSALFSWCVTERKHRLTPCCHLTKPHDSVRLFFSTLIYTHTHTHTTCIRNIG